MTYHAGSGRGANKFYVMTDEFNPASTTFFFSYIIKLIRSFRFHRKCYLAPSRPTNNIICPVLSL